MAEDATAGTNPLLIGLPDEIVIWEILVRLDPKSLLRCRAVRRDWRRVTSTRRFLLSHHNCQPTLPIFTRDTYIDGVHYRDIVAFDHRAAANARLHTVARLDADFFLEASCDGLLVLSKLAEVGYGRTLISICNPATREHGFLGRIPFGPPWGFNIMGMYSHRPTGEYRLLLQRRNHPDLPQDQVGCFVFVVASDQPPRYIGWPERGSGCYDVPVRVHDSLHWYQVYYPSEGNLPYNESESCPVIAFDTIAESFRMMRAPVGASVALFEMDGMLGMSIRNYSEIDIWMMQDYESKVWAFKSRVELPVAEISAHYENLKYDGCLMVVPGDGELFLLVQISDCLHQIDMDGKLVASFRHELLNLTKHQLKQTLVPDGFFPTLEGYVVNTWPFT